MILPKCASKSRLDNGRGYCDQTGIGKKEFLKELKAVRMRTIDHADGLLRIAIGRANLVLRAAADKNENTGVIDDFVAMEDEGYSLLPTAQRALL